MFRFQMVPHVRSRMIEKIITKSTTKFSQRIFPKDNVLVKISWPTDRCSTSFWKKILTFNKRLYYYRNFHYTCNTLSMEPLKVEKSALKKRKIKIKLYRSSHLFRLISSWMVHWLVNFHCPLSPHYFQADITGIGKIARKVFGLQVISHIRSWLMTEIVTNSTSVFFQRILHDDNVLVKVLMIGNVCS